MGKGNKIHKAVVWDVMQSIFGAFNDHQLHAVIYFQEFIEEECLKKAVDISIDMFPLIKCRFIEKAFFPFPYWEECSYSSQHIVRLINTEDMESTINRLIVEKTDEKLGPQLIVNLIRTEHCDSLCIIMNHMISDGAGFKEYLYKLSAIYSGLKEDPDYRPVLKEMGIRSTKQIFKGFSLSDKIRILRASPKLSKYNSGAVFPFEGDLTNPFIERRKISQEKFLKIKSYLKTHNATINDALLTAYVRCLVKTLKIKQIALPCPVDLRRYLPNRQSGAICNLTSNMICDIGEDIGETFQHTLIKVRNAMLLEKDSFSCLNGPLMLELIFGAFPYKTARKIVEKAFDNPAIAMTNIGVIDKNKLLFTDSKIKDTFVCGSIKYKHYFQIAITTYDNEITLSINYYGTEKDRIKIKEFLSDFEEELSYAVKAEVS